MAEKAVFPIDSGDTSHCAPGAVIEICSALHSLYPADDGSIVTFRSMPRNSRVFGMEPGPEGGALYAVKGLE